MTGHHTVVVINLLDTPDTLWVVVVFTCMKVLYLIGCTISVKRDAHLIVALVLAGQSDASSQRNLGIKKFFFFK